MQNKALLSWHSSTIINFVIITIYKCYDTNCLCIMKSTEVQNPRRTCSEVVEKNCLVAEYGAPYTRTAN